jgi:hypothetical protein
MLSYEYETSLYIDVLPFVNRYRHEAFDHGFGVQWMNDNEETTASFQSKQTIISVRSVFNMDGTRLPAHIWRSLTKV